MSELIRGLMTRNFTKDYEYNKFGMLISANVVRLEWKDLDKNPGAAYASVKKAAQYGPVRLRVNGGTEAPVRIINDNDPFDYHEGSLGDTYLCPQWWNDNYIDEWAFMMLGLHDNVGEHVTEVAQSGGGTRWSEPFIRSVWSNKDTFNDIGFDFAVDERALNMFYALMREIWAEKTLVVSVFSWQYMEDDRPKSSIDRSIEAIERWQPDLIGAHDLRENPGASRLEHWDKMKATGIPLYFQTAQPDSTVKEYIGDWTKALDYGLEYGALNIELPRTFNRWDYDTLGEYAWSYDPKVR